MTTAAVLVALIAPAMAGSGCLAVIKQTSDGFVALRDDNGQLVRKLSSGTRVMVDVLGGDFPPTVDEVEGDNTITGTVPSKYLKPLWGPGCPGAKYGNWAGDGRELRRFHYPH